MSLSKPAPKKRKNGRAKGKRGENAVAKMCAAWWAQLEPGVEFRSTPSSGGWATPQLRGHFKVAGDLTTTAKHWPFTVEVKRREGWTLARLYTAKPSPVWGWWKQACKSAAEEGRSPLLIFRHNNDEWLVLLPRTFAKLIPRLDSWGFTVTGIIPMPIAGNVPPMMTTWDVLRGIAPAAIIKACPVPASPPALGASQARPKSKPSKPPPLPSKARQRPAQAAASLPPVVMRAGKLKLTREDLRRRFGQVGADFADLIGKDGPIPNTNDEMRDILAEPMRPIRPKRSRS